MMACLPICLYCLPAHNKIEDKGTERNGMPSHQPFVHTSCLTHLSSQAFEGQSLAEGQNSRYGA